MFYSHFYQVERPPNVMKRSQRWNTLRIYPAEVRNSVGSDLYSNTLPVRPGRRTIIVELNCAINELHVCVSHVAQGNYWYIDNWNRVCDMSQSIRLWTDLSVRASTLPDCALTYYQGFKILFLFTLNFNISEIKYFSTNSLKIFVHVCC